MDTLAAILHIGTAVFIIGPMAILPMTGLRALRNGNVDQVRTLAKSITVVSWLSVLTIVFGFWLMSGAEGKEDKLTFTTPWIMWAIIAWIIAFALEIFVVVPQMTKAADGLAAPAEAPAEGAVEAAPASYGLIAASSGIAALLLVVAVILMIWRP